MSLAPEWERERPSGSAIPCEPLDPIWVYGFVHVRMTLGWRLIFLYRFGKNHFTGTKRTVPAQPPVANTYTARWNDYLW